MADQAAAESEERFMSLGAAGHGALAVAGKVQPCEGYARPPTGTPESGPLCSLALDHDDGEH